MNKQERRDLARLETKVDVLETEISYIDNMLRESGFPDGLSTLKAAVREILTDVNGKDLPDLDVDGLFA